MHILNQPRNGTYFRLLLAVTEVYGGKTVPSTSTSSSLQSLCQPGVVYVLPTSVHTSDDSQ